MISTVVSTVLGATILLLVFRFVLPKENSVDLWITAGFIAIPSIAISALSFGFQFVGVNAVWANVALMLFLIVPYVFFKSVEEYSSLLSIKISSIVFVVGLVATFVPYFLLMSMQIA